MSTTALSTGSAIQSVLDDAVARGLTPGAAAAIVRLDGTHQRFCSGHRVGDDSVNDDDDAVDPDTIYDLASLTKLLCTTTLLASAVDDELIALDEQPFERWPGVTVAHLLQHTAGLAAHRPLHEQAVSAGNCGLRSGRDLVVDGTLHTVPDAAAGTRTRYSDLGFIALGALLEQRRGQSLDVLFAQHHRRAAAPADAQSLAPPSDQGLRFVSLWKDGYHPLILQTAPTERCPWRRRAVQGQVHDENAFAMGGVAGHAGLFGSLVDVEDAALRLLRSLTQDTTLRLFARAPGERGLGFDKATPDGSTAGVLGPRAVGHLGFTGTSIWIDPDVANDDGSVGAAFVLLANTLYPTREGVLSRNKELRTAFHRAAVLGIADVAQQGASGAG